MEKNATKGITLIALIITIIVMLILVSVTIVLAINGELFSFGGEAVFKQTMSGYKESTEIYALIQSDENKININAGATDLTPKMDIKDILGIEIEPAFSEKVAIEAGTLYYVPIDDSKKTQREIKWCFELGIKVKGWESEEDFIEATAPVPSGEYVAKNGVYVNKPDVTGFSRAHTFYVTYDENGQNEAIGGKITTTEPSNWYDYQNKIWANIVTISEGKTAYWVWIPRYAYKITYYTDEKLTTLSEGNAVTSYGTVDVKFLSKDNIHKDFATGTETPYSSLEAQGYILPETFTWKKGEVGETQLAGYWVSKYEVNNIFNIAKLPNGDVQVISVGGLDSSAYEYYLDGELKYTGTGFYTYTDLEYGKTYELSVKQNGILIGTRKVTINVLKPNSIPKSEPDVSGFKDAIAYYVTYDENGQNETIGNRITFDANGKPNNIPTDWYNYQNKIWANIVTASEELTASEKADITTATTKNVAYWVWIPRYEYKIIDSSKEDDYVEGDTILNEFVSINFIDTKTVTPTIEGYTIPETFIWKKGTEDETQLSGYWVSKYEVSDVVTPTTE